MTAHDDPRDASAETKMTFPDTWSVDSGDALNASALFLSGLIMVTRNRYLAWPNLLFTLNSLFNQHPLRTKGESQNAATSRMIALSALVASYLPLFMLQPARTATQVPLPTPV